MQYENVRVRNQNASLLSTHTVLRQTYLLLSLTLLFSSACALYAVNTHASQLSSMVTSIIGVGLLFIISGLRNSPAGIIAVFAFTGCMGYSLGPLLNLFIKDYSNGGQLIATALGGTGFTFLLSSAYIISTKKDMSHLSRFLMTGLIVCIVMSLANFFFKMPAMQLAISAMLTFIATLLIMFDTSRIINSGQNNYLMATVSLYLDILMLFQNLLILLGALGGNRN